jgi:hypothetical protein
MSVGCRPPARWFAVLAVLALPAAAPAAEAIDLYGGFQPDPAAIGYAATGREEAAAWVRGCQGHVDSGPAVTVNLTDANALLHVYLVGDGAAGVLAAGPDGIHHCEAPDQFGITHLRFGRVMPGEYLVWPLTAEPGATVSGTILVSELELETRAVAAETGLKIDPSLLPPLITEVPLDPSAEPAFGRLALPGSGTSELTITLAGGVPAADAGPGCAGDITQTRPDAVLGLDVPEPLVAISASAEPDTTLLVVTPEGEVLCNDDAVSYHPAVAIADAQPGDYAIWVGVYSGGEGQEAVLSVGREAPEGVAPDGAAATLEIDAEPAAGRHELPADGLLELALVLAGGVGAGEVAPGCGGEIDPSRPDAAITLMAPEPMLWFHAAAEGADTTLIVVGPDGDPLCNDDHDGFNPAVGVAGATPGVYAVWVGVWSGAAGASATLTVGRDEPAGGAGGGLEINPFAGRPVGSAAEAFSILVEALELGETLSYDRLEETGPEGLILHGVALRDPAGAEAPVTIGRIRVSDLDLAGLSEFGAPERFAIAFEDIGYAALADDLRANDLPVPVLAEPPAFSLSVSLLPPGADATRRELRLDLTLEGQAALGVATRMLWQDGMAAMGPAAAFALMGESIEIELHDMGFLGAVLREIAVESGQGLDEMIAQGLDEMAADLGQPAPGSPGARLHDAVSAKLRDLDRPGVLRIRLRAAEPSGMETLFEALSAETLDESRFSLEIGYEPDN